MCTQIWSKATYKLSMSESHHFTVYQVGKRRKNHVTIIRSLYPSRIDYVHPYMPIQRKLTNWVWANHTISQCIKWGKGANHVTIIRSLYPSRIGYVHPYMSIQRKLTSWVWANHTVSQCSKWGKEQIMLPLSDHFPPVKDKLSLHAIKYVHSKETYRLSMSESQCSKCGKGANHVISQLHLSRIDYCYVHSNTSIQRQLTSWECEWITPFHSVASGEKEQITLSLSDHFPRQG